MSLLLMSKTAERPFYYDKLNIRLYSAEELCWCIYNYPLLALDGLVTDGLIEWMGGELGATVFAEELETGKKAGESTENLLLGILQSGNLYTQAEIRSFRNRMLELTKLPKSTQLKETAKSLYRAGRYHQAAEKYEEAAKELMISLRTAKTEEEALSINDEKAEVYCDLACIHMRMFDEPGALRALDLAEATGFYPRAEEYRYLINRTGRLSEEEKQKLEERRDALYEKAAGSLLMKRIRKLSGTEHEDFFTEAAAIVKDWKKEYRKTS